MEITSEFHLHHCHTVVSFRASVGLELIWTYRQRETPCPYLNHTPAVQDIAGDFTDNSCDSQ